MTEIPVEVWQIVRDDEGRNVVLLRDGDGRLLPIPIGICEAAAIWARLAPEVSASLVRRPWSHDLMRSMVERLGAKLTRVVVDGWDRGTFYATLHLEYGNREIVVDSRPSDAIALMLRTASPIFVTAEVLDETAYPSDSSTDTMGFEPPGDIA